MYRVKQDADNSYIVYIYDGQPVIRLEGGTTELILLTFQNMSQYEHRGDDYMAGVIQGIMHCHMIAPQAFTATKHTPDEEIGPDPRLFEGDEDK